MKLAAETMSFGQPRPRYDEPYVNPKVFGQNGNDTISGSGEFHGGRGNDRLDGDGLLFGEGGNDMLFNGFDASGSSTLAGGEGDDTLAVYSEDNVLTGGDGADVFQLRLSSSIDQVNIISDFEQGIDKIVLANTIRLGLPWIPKTNLKSWSLSSRGRMS
ncbi:MAG: hypothetical protein AcusKO_25170 [Acuticoccus sp.]